MEQKSNTCSSSFVIEEGRLMDFSLGHHPKATDPSVVTPSGNVTSVSVWPTASAKA